MTKDEITQKYVDKGKSHIIALTNCQSYKDTITLYCTKHQHKWNAQLGSNLYKKYSCPECAKEGISKAKTSQYNLWEINYDIAKLLENPDDAIGLSNGSKKKVWFVCPNCNNRLYKSVVNVSNFGLACNVCSDGFSYPNKLMYNILTDINIDFIAEYSPKWISPRRYDFCIEKYKIIIEMDGGLGHGKKAINNSKISVSKSLEIDIKKDKIAKEHGYKVIRINSDQSEISYIQNNIINSELKEYFDFSNIDWKQCDLKSQNSLLVEICEYYNNNPYVSYKELSKIYNISVDTISRYLRTGYNNNLCPKYTTSFDNPIICVESNIIFPTASNCGEYYNLDSSMILKCCRNNNKTTGNLHFMFLKDYDKIYQRKEIDYNVFPKFISNKRPINMYDKSFKYICTYESITEAAEKNNKTLRIIIKSCNSKHAFNYGKTFYYADDPNQPDPTKIIPKVS